MFVNVLDIDSELFQKAKGLAGNGGQLVVGVIKTSVDDDTLVGRVQRVKQDPFVNSIIVGTSNTIDGAFIEKYNIDMVCMVSGEVSPCDDSSKSKLVVVE